MKKRFAAILSALTIGLAVPGAMAGENVVLIELFTSQGCPSCPPADRNLAELAKRDDVLALSLHVDYWDYLGWRDTFARHEHTERQLAYRDLMGKRVVYTPQMVVNGMQDVRGSHTARLKTAIAEAQSGRRAATITISGRTGMLKAMVRSDIQPEPCTVWIASFDLVRSVEVARGENAGRTLTYHNVVHRLIRIGNWDGTAQEIALPQPGSGGGIAIWLQDDKTGQVLTASFVEK